MPIDRDALTPQQRLAISRRALVNQLGGAPASQRDDAEASGPLLSMATPSRVLDRFAWTSMARKVATRWWRRHPANAAGQLARPLLERYAKQQPVKLVATAAVAGALIVLLRPWRLLSVTAVVAAVMKSSDVADMVTTLMHKGGSPKRDPAG